MSVLTDDNVAHVLETIITYLPEGPQYYPEDMVTDQPERFLMAELIREKVLQLTHEEGCELFMQVRGNSRLESRLLARVVPLHDLGHFVQAGNDTGSIVRDS